MTNPNPRRENLKPFVKGDPRINRKGVPRTVGLVREFIQQVGAEEIELPATSTRKSEKVTRFYAFIRTLYSSKAPADHALILKATTPGLLKDEIDVTSGGEPLSDQVVRVIVHDDSEDKPKRKAKAKPKRKRKPAAKPKAKATTPPAPVPEPQPEPAPAPDQIPDPKETDGNSA